MGNGNSCGGDDLTGDYCVCFASEREGKACLYYFFDKFSATDFSPLLLVTQREDELERRRVSHHINFDAL